MNIFTNAVTLRGFLGRNAEVPSSEGIKSDSYAVLTLCVESGAWNKAANEWVPRTAHHRIVCPGTYFCGFTRGMEQGEYLEVEGELRIDLIVDCADPRNPHPECRVYATQIRRLEVPTVGVDEGGEREDT